MGLRVPVRDFLTALCADRLALILCVMTGNEKTPPLYSESMTIREEAPETGRFASGEDFEEWKRGRMKGS